MMARILCAAGLGLLLLARAAQSLEPSEMLSNPTLEARARAIGRELRCLVCQNESIETSDAPLAHDLRLLIRRRLVSGDSDKEVIRYIVSRYGIFVLLDPPFVPVTYLLWLAPPALFVGAAALLFLRARRRPGEETVPALSPEERARAARLLGERL